MIATDSIIPADATPAHRAYVAAREAWQLGASLRSRRRRFKSYTYGRQWDDLTVDNDGHTVTEGEYASISGKRPLTNNIIRQLIKSIVGRFRHSIEKDAAPLSTVAADNQLNELDSRLLEEFLISGCAIQRVVRERRPGRGDGVWIDNVSPERFFINRFSDPRGDDIRLVGMLHDMSLAEVVMRYSHGDLEAGARIADIYRNTLDIPLSLTSPMGAEDSGLSFDHADAPGRCRVIEVWTLECTQVLRCHDPHHSRIFLTPATSAAAIEKINMRRAEQSRPSIDTRLSATTSWRGYFFAPGGQLLDSTLSPYLHGRHPFVVKFYPLIDGEVHPFVEDVIDQQRYVNRLITLIDHVMSFSAKGVLLFPAECKPDAVSWEQVTSQWCRPNGVIPYNVGGAEPRQIYSTGSVQGAYELLNTEMRLFEQTSGVSNALQGQRPDNQTSASLYQSQVENSTIALLDTFATFNAMRRDRDRLVEKTVLVDEF